MSSISQLSLEANAYTFNPRVSFASWLHVSQTLLRESRIYDAEDQDLERAYVLYLRFCDLVLNKLRSHPDFGTHKKQYTRVYNQLTVAIERSENLKERILKRREETSVVSQPSTSTEKTSSHTQLSLKGPKKPLTLEEEIELYSNVTDDSRADVQFDPSTMRASDFTSSYRSTTPVFSPRKVINEPQYPKLSPQLSGRSSTVSFEPRPNHIADGSTAHRHTEVSTSSSVISSIPSTAVNERGEPLRHVFVPKTLREQFLKIAKSNTDNNLETCGMLCGKLERNAFFVTDLVIPHQVSTADTCATTNEEELFEYVDERDLFLLGWIHTHPSQSCFMSSVDLHTHASYQLMLLEAIAIVCAPSHEPSWAAFRLTDPPGIPVIRACKLTGFHPHDNPESLYMSASKPGHYQEISSNLVTKDMRGDDRNGGDNRSGGNQP